MSSLVQASGIGAYNTWQIHYVTQLDDCNQVFISDIFYGFYHTWLVPYFGGWFLPIFGK